MKLFQQLLVAGASLSLIAPIGAEAADLINLDGMNSYSRSKKKSTKKRFDSKSFTNQVNDDLANRKGDLNELEAQQNYFDAGSFSDTTTFSGSAVFAIGAADGASKIVSTHGDSVQTLYTYTIDLNTSFSGDDNLYVRLRTGANGPALGDKPALYHPARYSKTSDVLAVDKIWYQFPIGDNVTAWYGPLIENYYMYAATPSLYKPASQKAFKLGSASAAFGASTAQGAGLKYEFGDGWAFSSNIVTKDADSSKGVFTDQATSKWDSMLAYTKDQYHVSLTVSQQYNGWNSFSYYATEDALDLYAGNDGVNKPNATAYALRSYWRPEESGGVMPEVSFGFDNLSMQGNHSKFSEASSWFVGLGWKDMVRPDDTIGLAYGALLNPTQMAPGAGATSDLDPSLWEAYYSFMVNDSVQLTPAVFGGNDVHSDTSDDVVGAVLTAKFKF